MKILLAMILLTVQAVVCFAADECEYRDVEPDPFTKEIPYVATKQVRLTSWLGGLIGSYENDNSEFRVSAAGWRDQYYLLIKFRLRRSTRSQPYGDDIRDGLVVPEGAELMILLADRSVIKLPADHEVRGHTVSELYKGVYVVDTSGSIRYRLDADAAAALTGSNAERVRFTADGSRLNFVNKKGNVDFNIAKDSRNKIKHVILCLQALENEGAS